MRIGMLGLLCAVLLLVGFNAHGYFRYMDENGKLVLSQSIPNERVKYGYDIVDQHGNLIQRVDPQLTPEQYAAKKRRDEAQRMCQAKLNRTHKLYQTQEDIDYAERQALDSLELRLANTRANLTVVQNQRRDFESTAAQLDVAGKAIPNTLLNNIERAVSQEDNLRREIEMRNEERGQLRNEFAFDRIVFDMKMEECADGLPPKPNVTQQTAQTP